MFTKKMKTGLLLLVMGVISHVEGTTLLFDDFDDDVPGTATVTGINGGVKVNKNSPAAVALSESGSQIVASVTGGSGNGGIVTINSFDPTSVYGFQARFDVASISRRPTFFGNGQFLGLMENNTSFFRNVPNIGLVFFGKEERTKSEDGFSLVINESGTAPNANILSDQDVELASYLDGFVASMTFTRDGWSYSIDGLNDTVGSPMQFMDSGAWSDPNFYATHFDDSMEYVIASAQKEPTRFNAAALTHTYNSISITAVPEPATYALMLGMLGIARMAKRKKAPLPF